MDRPNRPSPEAPGRPSPLPSDADWPQLLRQAALRFLGEPAKRHRGEWRYRSRGSLVVHVEGPRAGTWRDFEGGSGGGVLDFLEQFAGLDRAQALAWLPGRPALLPRRRTSHPTRPDTDARHRFDLARSQWASSKPIPTSPDHPARRWLARRKLWWPSLPLPPSVRWLDARGTHTGAGGIIVLAAPPSAWADVWPQLPALVAVQLVHLDAGGQPALDRPLESGGLQKRTYGLVRGAALIIGNPILEEALTPARVAEGLADTLALARRYEGPGSLHVWHIRPEISGVGRVAGRRTPRHPYPQRPRLAKGWSPSRRSPGRGAAPASDSGCWRDSGDRPAGGRFQRRCGRDGFWA